MLHSRLCLTEAFSLADRLFHPHNLAATIEAFTLGKAPGLDGAPTEPLRLMGHETMHALALAFNAHFLGFAGTPAPQSYLPWTHHLVYLLPKSQHMRSVTEFREIACISTLKKWYAQILTAKANRT